jgi:hypothetical protein
LVALTSFDHDFLRLFFTEIDDRQQRLPSTLLLSSRGILSDSLLKQRGSVVEDGDPIT